MDASSVLTLSILLLTCAHLSSQVFNEEDSSSAAALATTEHETVQNVTEQKNCTTATGVAGNCLIRRICNYGTDAVDLTMYAPRGFVQPCKTDEVCCPFDYQLPEVPTHNNKQTDEDFEFNNGD